MLRRNSISNRRLESLESRDVPATLDLTTVGSSGEANGAIVRQWDTQANPIQDTHTFLRLHDSGRENGYNTNARPLQFDAVGGRNTTRALSLDRVPTVVEGGLTYREFLLDVNQRNRSPFINLDEVRIFLGATGNLRNYNINAKTLAGMNSVFDLDGAGDVTVRLNARLNSGNRPGDMYLLVPESVFAGHLPTEFVYLYSNFSGANGGAESWSVGPQQAPPAAGTASLSGFAFFDADGSGVFNPDEGEVGQEGVIFQLTGTNDLGQSVLLSATTDANGFFNFTALRAGTYTITRMSDPAPDPDTGFNFVNGFNSVGSVNGTPNGLSEEGDFGADLIGSIVVGNGDTGSGYNFGHVFAPQS